MAAARAVVPGDAGGVLSMFDQDTATFLFDYERPGPSPPRSYRNASARASPLVPHRQRSTSWRSTRRCSGRTAAWSWQINRARVTDDEGTSTELSWRVTDVWPRVDGRWRAVHQHASFRVFILNKA